MATSVEDHEDLLREFLDFGDDLILPDKPVVKKEYPDYGLETSGFQLGPPDIPTIKKEFPDYGLGTNEYQDDIFLGATPSPSSSSTASSNSGAAPAQQILQSNSPSYDFAMSVANDFMDIDFGPSEMETPDLSNDFNVEFADDRDANDFQNSISPAETIQECPSGLLNDVTVVTDLGAPLKVVRRKLEKKFLLDLSDFGFILQDKILDDHTPLSEQCIEGEGPVKVQVQINDDVLNGTKSISIIDVVRLESGSETDNDVSSEEEEAEIDTKIQTIPESSTKNFVESAEFGFLRQRFNIPASILNWSRFQTLQWAKWVNRTFTGVKLKEDHWAVDGTTLQSLSREHFSKRAGSDPGGNLWSHFSYLRETGVAMIPLNLATLSFPDEIFEKSRSSMSMKRSSDTSGLMSSFGSRIPPKKQRIVLGKYEEGKVFINTDESSTVHRSGNNGNSVQLWRFLLDILTDYRYRDIIRWSFGEGCREGEFIMTEPEGVARLWGQQKGKATMNYEKLSRALRYYKGGNVLDKVQNKKFTYRFVCDLRDLVGYSAFELEKQVQEQAFRQGFC